MWQAEGSVKFLGHVADMPAAYAASDIVVVPGGRLMTTPVLTIHVYDDADFEKVVMQAESAASYALTGAIIAQWQALQTAIGQGKSQYNGVVPINTSQSGGTFQMLDPLRGTGGNEGLVSVRGDLRSMVRFGQLNLQSPVWPAQERFDVIFCRNVVIYFDREFQKKLLNRLADLLVPGGLLMVGHSESFPAAHPGFRSVGRTAYERVAG